MKIIGQNHMRVSVSLRPYFNARVPLLSRPGDREDNILTIPE